VTLRANITSGIAPLTTYFSVSTEIPNAVALYEMDFEGNSSIDYTGATFEDIGATYQTEGKGVYLRLAEGWNPIDYSLSFNQFKTSYRPPEFFFEFT